MRISSEVGRRWRVVRQPSAVNRKTNTQRQRVVNLILFER